jgi:Mn-containing catalase
MARSGRRGGHLDGVFNHVKHLQFDARPDGPDAAFARRLQDALGGRWGALTVAHQYLMQGWTCRLPGKYRDLLLDVGTEELAHVEMLSTMITRLLQDAPLTAAENQDDPARCADPYSAHLVQAGAGPLLGDSNGVPWSGSYVTASGSLLADFHLNAGAEAQSRLRLARLFHMTGDPGVKQLLRYLLARDTMHQNVWLAAIEELRADGIEDMPVPEAFPDAAPDDEHAHTYLSFSDGGDAAAGRWAHGPAPDGNGELSYQAHPGPQGEPPALPPADPRLYCS